MRERGPRLMPTHYLAKEGGRWIEWNRSSIPILSLQVAQSRVTTINPTFGYASKSQPFITVHALKFKDGKIWDMINGFREEAQNAI